jgi:hypothetical protein
MPEKTFLEKLSDASVRHRIENDRPASWVGQTLSTAELLHALRCNHEAMNRDDSPYWQAELKILSLLDALDMIATLVSQTGDPDDVRVQEISRIIAQSSE